MKKTATILVIILLLFTISCSQDAQAPKNIDVTPVAGEVKDLDVASKKNVNFKRVFCLILTFLFKITHLTATKNFLQRHVTSSLAYVSVYRNMCAEKR